MILLILGIIVFIGIHLVPTSPPARDGLIARLGANNYKIAFSVASIIGFVMIVWGMALARGSAADFQLWVPPVWTKHIAFVLMLPAFILLVASNVPSHIRDRAKHPMLAAIKIWALAHLIANGNLSGLILFGSFLAYGVYDRISVKKRGALGPLGTKHGGLTQDIIVVVVGSASWVVTLVWAHKWLFGIPLIG